MSLEGNFLFKIVLRPPDEFDRARKIQLCTYSRSDRGADLTLWCQLLAPRIDDRSRTTELLPVAITNPKNDWTLSSEVFSTMN